MKLTKNKKIILGAFLALLILAPCLVLADADDGWGIPDADKYGDVPSNFDTAIMNITNWLLGFVSMLAVLAIIWGGINYLGSVGDEERIRTAKKTITYGLIGVIVAGLAYAIVKVIVSTILT